ncbi:MAG: translocation/assembly module TamB domain-containing protein, partial [Bacteroidia bacterium]|nr:translocation/assembly module TamB domain-containing protein [Bacteroidia bacterium]
DIELNKSLVNLSDLKYFVPFVKDMNESVWLSGKVSGTVSELRGRNINLSFSDYTLLDCDFDFSGLPDIENSFIYIGINNLVTNAKDIEKIKIPGKNAIRIPELLYKLGTVTFNGTFTGFTTDFVTYGKLITSEGTISTDISFRPQGKNKFQIKGLVKGSNIALGQLTGKPQLFGNLSMKADVDGYAYSLKKFNGNLTGLIDSIEINNYKYRNISLNGIFSENTWDGNIKISEDNIKMDLLGMFNFSSELPEFDFTLNLAHADLHRLNFNKSDTSSSLSMLLTANFTGNNIDNLDGEIKILNSNMKKYDNILDIYDFSIKTFTENNKPAISLRTDYMDADLRGHYNFAGLGTLFKTALSSMMPSRFSTPVIPEELNRNNFTFNINFKNTDKINNFFRTGLLLADKSSISGEILVDSIISVRGESKNLSFKGINFKDLSVDASFLSPDLLVKVKSSSLNLLGQSELMGFTVDLYTHPDNFILTTDWDNKGTDLNRGSFIVTGTFIKSENEKANPFLKITIDSTRIYSRNNLWQISRSGIVLDSNSVSINKLYISNKERYYLVDGTLSDDPGDTLHLEFKGIDISPLNYLINKNKKPDKIALSLKGLLNGQVLLTNLYKNPLIESNLKINNLSLLQSDYGDLSIVSEWNKEKKIADIHAENNLDNKKLLEISGNYDPAMKKIDLTAKADKLPIDALNPLLKIFASGISGTATGKVNLSGEMKKLVLKGALMAENASMKIDYLQTKYKINDSIRFDKNDIIFKNIKVTDEKGNTATLNGSVYHKYFKGYSADIIINANDCMVLNTRPKDNNLFYGTAYATGVTTIKSIPGSLSFDISAKTGKNTKFYIPLNSSETISEYSFITFINTDSTNHQSRPVEASIPLNTAKTGIDLNFDLEVAPDAEVQLIFDLKGGDVMKGHGSGDLNINLNKKGEFKISGDYVIEDGDYLFTLGNMLNKSFSVENGGKISFNGDIKNAEIDMKAIYKLKASLYEILQDERFNERIPVECQINLSGKLFNPVVNLDIYLPLADEATRTYLKNVITTEEELSRQFLYLLVMNSFYADPSYGTSRTNTTSTGTSAMAVTTTEMVSNQLSNWLSQISNDFEIGFTYRPGYKDINSDEVQLALSTQLLNDKVVINGNFDVRGTTSGTTSGTTNNTDQLTGDFDIEYKITEKIRFKVFNRFNNPYTGKQAPYTQGFGLFFRQDFDNFSDLFRKKTKSDMKKEEEPVVPEN